MDQVGAPSGKQRGNLEYLSQVPDLEVAPGLARVSAEPDSEHPGRVPQWPFFSSGLLPGPETARLDMLISGIVLPEGGGPDEDHRRMKDVHHLGAHLVAGHHYFVTKDYDDIVKKRDWLRAEVGIKVATLPEAVDLPRGETRASEPATRPGIEAFPSRE